MTRGRAPTDRPLSVYALVAGRSLPMTFHAGGGRFRLVRRGTIGAIVSDRSAPAKPTASDLRRYDRVMRELAERFPAILPARFGTSMAEDELLFILSARRTSLARKLASVRGRVQMTVRVVVGRGVTAAANADPARHAFTGASGRDYLTVKSRAAAEARTVPAFEPVRKAVARWIRDERVDRRAEVASIYHLIPRASVEVYRRTLNTAAESAAVRLVVTGPWPPYAFGTD